MTRPPIDLSRPVPYGDVTERDADLELAARRGRIDRDRELALRSAPIPQSSVDLHRFCHCRGDVFGLDMTKVNGVREPKR